MSENNLIHIGIRKIQKLGRIAIGKDELESKGLCEGENIDVYFKKVNKL